MRQITLLRKSLWCSVQAPFFWITYDDFWKGMNAAMIKKNNINNRKSQNRSRSEILAPPRREFQQTFRKSLIQFRLVYFHFYPFFEEFVSNFQTVLTQCEQWIFPDYREASRLHQKYLDLKNLMADRIELLLIFKWTKQLVLKGNNWYIIDTQTITRNMTWDSTGRGSFAFNFTPTSF